jgi:hypothetical protein
MSTSENSILQEVKRIKDQGKRAVIAKARREAPKYYQ